MHSLSGFSALCVPLPGYDWHAFASNTKVPSCEGGGGHGERRRPSKITPHERAARAAVSACLHNMLYLVRTIFYFSKLRAAPSRAPRIPLTARRSGLDTDFHTTHTPSCNKHFPSKDRQQQQANSCSTRYESFQRVAFNDGGGELPVVFNDGGGELPAWRHDERGQEAHLVSSNYGSPAISCPRLEGKNCCAPGAERCPVARAERPGTSSCISGRASAGMPRRRYNDIALGEEASKEAKR